MLNVSESTIYRRMRQRNLSICNLYDEILDDDLDQTVSEIVKEFPRCREAMVREILRQRDVQVRGERMKISFIIKTSSSKYF